MADLMKVRVLADEIAEKSGLTDCPDREIFANGFVEGVKVALHCVSCVATRGNILEVLKYCKLENKN